MRLSAAQLSAAQRVHAEDIFELGIKSPERVSVSVDGAGQGHVLTITDDQALYDLVVGAKGLERTELVAAHVAGRTLATAFDAEGRLHVVIHEQHFVRAAGGWSSAQEGPACKVLLLAGKTLLCAYLSSHPPKGAGYRFDWVYVPQLLIVPPLPIPTRNDRLVIECLAEGQWVVANVLEPFAKRDVERFVGTADDFGNVRIVYLRTRYVLLSDVAEVMFATRRGPYTCPPEASADASGGFVDTMVPLAPGEQFSQFALSANRSTGEFVGLKWNLSFASVLAFRGSRDTGAVVERGGLEDPPVDTIGEVRIVAADPGRFHVLLRDGSKWRYIALTGTAWSAPIDVGDCEDCTIAGIASNDSPRALVAWWYKKMLRARWISLPSQH